MGAGIVTKFLAEGARVVVLDWDIKPLQAAPPPQDVVAVVQGDISKPESWALALKAAIDTWGRLDIVVNCAGIVSKDTVVSRYAIRLVAILIEF